MLDEVDKVGMDWRGDPSSALLEVLDPAQNHAFRDHYLDVDFDLSDVMFITTANQLETIPPALRDRMEIIELPGYILEEKVQIARKYLIPRRISESGLKSRHIDIKNTALLKIISSYTREAGVRNLERAIGTICRKVAKRVAEGKHQTVHLTNKNVQTYLGPPRAYAEVAARRGETGVATGLAWTPFGGEILFIESIKLPGKKDLILTGRLGDVMKESCQAALSFLRFRAKKWNIPADFFKNSDIHIHVPAGAIPKDGPSAGLAIAMSLASLFRAQPIDPTIAFSGEITLTGRVLPVGGIKEKIIAAKRAGIKTILLPSENKHDLKEIPKQVKAGLSFNYVRTIDQALNKVFSYPKKGRERT
jgi:ATP-dependent Lon protease